VKIDVENYKTIRQAELHFNSGIYKVIGVNNDSSYTSNGAGKSTIMQALVLGLYNKDFTGAPLESLSNRTTGNPYKITVTFQATIEGKLRLVTVINSASTRMRLLIDGESSAMGATSVVPMVEKIMGMGYNTFKLTHYITSATITNLTQNLSQPTIFNDILHLVEVQELDKKLLIVSKELNKEIDVLKAKDKIYQQSRQIIDMQNKYDLDTITIDLESASADLDTLEALYYTDTADLKTSIRKLKDTSSKTEGAITEAKGTLRHGVCSLCNTILVGKKSLESINVSIRENQEKLNVLQTELQELENQLQIIETKYMSRRDKLTRHVSMLNQDYNMAKEFNTLDITETVDQSPLLTETEKEYAFVTSARKEVKSGAILKDILDQFFDIVTLKLREYSELIKLHFQVEILSDKLGMSIQLTQNKILVPIESLSNGERTRLSLLVLISMLDAMKVVSEAETNVVIFDESSASLDASGAEEMMNLFSYLKHLGQSVFLITHGSELDMIPYDYQLTISKNQGQSEIIVQEL
jgi:DNA repair exonuclease SbcCD ATPase subunit